MKAIANTLVVAMPMVVLHAQSIPPHAPTQPTAVGFEVATIKPTSPNDLRVGLFRQPGGHFTAFGIPLISLLQEAFGVTAIQISGGPNWIRTRRWDVQAKAENVTGPIPVDEFRGMLRMLLEDRFQLKAHRETTDKAAYELTIDKSGLKLKASVDDGLPGTIRSVRREFSGKKLPISRLVERLSQELQELVVDKTGLTDRYDITLTWTSEPGVGFDATTSAEEHTIFESLQKQLGLKLVRTREAIQILIIDRVESPSGN